MKESEVSVICKALGDANRLKIVNMLKKGEKCGCVLLEEFKITQPTLSHHMKILCESGIVNARKEGKWSHYTINCEKFKEFKEYINAIVCTAGENECCGK